MNVFSIVSTVGWWTGALLVAVAAASLFYRLVRRRITAPHIELSVPSGRSWGAAFWRSVVWYDVAGTPYAKAYGTGAIRLLPNGKTDDCLYKTTWTHVSGPPVNFNGVNSIAGKRA